MLVDAARAFLSGSDATMLPSAALHPDVRFESRQLVNELIGEREYRDAASRWLTDAQDVQPNFRTVRAVTL